MEDGTFNFNNNLIFDGDKFRIKLGDFDLEDDYTKTKDSVDNMNNYFDFTDSGLVIGKKDNKFKTKLDNEKLSFLQDDSEVAYVSNNKLYISEGEITDNLKINNFIWQPRSNGNMSIKFIGN